MVNFSGDSNNRSTLEEVFDVLSFGLTNCEYAVAPILGIKASREKGGLSLLAFRYLTS